MIFDCRISDKLQKSQDLKESQNSQKSQNSDGKKCIIAGSWSLAHIHSQGLENTLFDYFLVNSIQERFFSLFSRETQEREDHWKTTGRSLADHWKTTASSQVISSVHCHLDVLLAGN